MPHHDHQQSLENEVARLLDASVYRLMSSGRIHGQLDQEKLQHVIDWLRAAVINEEPWLKNVDDRGRPKKLMKFGSFEQIVKESDKAMLKAAQKLRGVTLVEEDEELVEVLEDGYYVVRLLTPAALDRETAVMGHCVGNGSYDRALEDDAHAIMSLRGPAGRSHVTMELINGYLLQFQGKQNNPPIDKYCRLLSPFLRARAWGIEVPATKLGYLIDKNGDWHSIRDLPVGLEISRTVDLSKADIRTLPPDLTIKGDLVLTWTALERLPENLTVSGTLCLDRTKIEEVPSSLKVGGSMSLLRSAVRFLPDNMIVGGTLDLQRSGVSVLPRGLKVGGDLCLDGSTTELSEGMSIGGTLYIKHTNVRKLPADVHVGGALVVGEDQIDELPPGIGDNVLVFCGNDPIRASEFRKKLSVVRRKA